MGAVDYYPVINAASNWYTADVLSRHNPRAHEGSAMTWRPLLIALVFQFVSGFATLLTPLARAAEPSEKVVRLGFVFPGDQGTRG
jgi:hypothetical protein